MDSSFRSVASLETLRRRARFLQDCRSFFESHQFLEIETPILANEVIPETHIDPPCLQVGTMRQWLQASPEAFMKRALASGADALYQIGRAFRAGEVGRIHQSEFTMLEWYHTAPSMEAGIEFLEAFIAEMLGESTCERISYQSALDTHANIDPFSASDAEVQSKAQSLVGNALDASWTRDDCLDAILVHLVEPNLGFSKPCVLYHYPESQGALAKLTHDANGNTVAERFELYWKGIELANGYHELSDPLVLRERFEKANHQRVAQGKSAIPMPEAFLSAMESGIPNSCGVALGFDRLVMLALGKSSIAEVIAFPTEE